MKFWTKRKEVNKHLDKLPEHIAIVMDGNGRWAKSRFLPRRAGHRAGADTLRKLTDYASELGLKHLTVYAFSTENWKRSKEEVSDLMDLLREYIKSYIGDAYKKETKIDMIGDISELDYDLQQNIIELTEITKNKAGLNLNIALNYGGRDEIVRCVKKISSHVINNELMVDNISEEIFQGFLDTNTNGANEVDLLIRTGGERRISNFLLWQIAYAELYFTDVLWPDFNYKHLIKAIEYFNSRKRNFGGR